MASCWNMPRPPDGTMSFVRTTLKFSGQFSILPKNENKSNCFITCSESSDSRANLCIFTLWSRKWLLKILSFPTLRMRRWRPEAVAAKSRISWHVIEELAKISGTKYAPTVAVFRSSSAFMGPPAAGKIPSCSVGHRGSYVFFPGVMS
jgi:hypothetical protein